MELKVVKQVGASMFKHGVRLALALVGHKGGGKTQTAEDLGIELGVPYFEMRISSMNDVGDVMGMPYYCPETHMTKYGTPQWFDAMKSGGVLCLDEINRARPALLDAVMQLTDKYRFNEYLLPKNVLIVCTLNPSSGSDKDEYDVNEFDSAMADRLICVRVDENDEEETDYQIEHQFDPEVIDLTIMSREAKMKGGSFDMPKKDYTRRSRRQLNSMMPVVRDVPKAEGELVIACCGHDGFAAWNNRSVLKAIPTAEEYFANPDKVDVTKLEGLHMTAFLSRCLGFLKQKKATEPLKEAFTTLCSKLDSQMLLWCARLCIENAWLGKYVTSTNAGMREAGKELAKTLVKGE
jgi:hypothetical protein